MKKQGNSTAAWLALLVFSLVLLACVTTLRADAGGLVTELDAGQIDTEHAWLSLSMNNRMIMLHEDGRVEMPPDMEAAEGARVFWEAVRLEYPSACPGPSYNAVDSWGMRPPVFLLRVDGDVERNLATVLDDGTVILEDVDTCEDVLRALAGVTP